MHDTVTFLKAMEKTVKIRPNPPQNSLARGGIWHLPICAMF